MIASPRNITLRSLRTGSLSDEIADVIVDAIASGGLEPGQKIIEADIANQLRVSRIPVREALKILESQGIVTSSPNRGSRVMEMTAQRATHVRDARVAIELLALDSAVAAYAREPDRLKKLDAIIESMRKYLAVQDWDEVNQQDIAFHRELIAASENKIVATLWETMARHILILFGREIEARSDRQSILREHQVLRNALERGDLASVKQLMTNHINLVPDASLSLAGRARRRKKVA